MKHRVVVIKTAKNWCEHGSQAVLNAVINLVCVETILLMVPNTVRRCH